MVSVPKSLKSPVTKVAAPQNENQKRYIGIDVSKESSMVANSTVDQFQQKKFTHVPVKKVEHSREGFVNWLKTIPNPRDTYALLESTGHYGLAFEHFMQENGIHVYRMTPRKKYSKHRKTDEFDARAILLALYNQEELHIQRSEEEHRIYPLIEPSPAIRQLRGLVMHRHERSQMRAADYNRLTALLDEVFPEFKQVIRATHGPKALWIREHFPTPADIADAPLKALCSSRIPGLPGPSGLAHMQELAATTIGTKDTERLLSIKIEQRQLIESIRLLSAQIDELDALIEPLVMQSREGQILTSFLGIGATNAAILMAGMGSIANFESSGQLKAYMGWAPDEEQTGVTTDKSKLRKGGDALLRETMYLVAMGVISWDPTWRAYSDRKKSDMTWYDAKKKRRRGAMRVIGHVAGQVIKVMYFLLRKDHTLVTGWKGRPEDLPAPQLYDVAKHRSRGDTSHQAPTAIVAPTKRRRLGK